MSRDRIDVSRLRTEGDQRWARFVASYQAASFFHDPDWLRLLSDSFGHAMETHIAEIGHSLVGGLPLMRVQLPLLGHKLVGLPLTASFGLPLASDQMVARRLIESAVERARASGADRLELRGPLNDPAAATLEASPTGTHDATLLLANLSMDTLSELARGHVSRAMRRDLQIRRAGTLAEWRTFHSLLARAGASGGIPPDWALLERLFERRNGAAQLRVAYRHGVIVGGVLALAGAKTVVQSALIVDPQHLSSGAARLLTWRTLEWAQSAGHSRFVFAADTLADPDARAFAEGCGATLRPLATYVARFGTGALADRVSSFGPLGRTSVGRSVDRRWRV